MVEADGMPLPQGVQAVSVIIGSDEPGSVVELGVIKRVTGARQSLNLTRMAVIPGAESDSWVSRENIGAHPQKFPPGRPRDSRNAFCAECGNDLDAHGLEKISTCVFCGAGGGLIRTHTETWFVGATS